MRAAAYTGTRNIYGDMVTAAKSLLYHTAIDKVYFLIEDDALPWDVPDVIECINVSKQTLFTEDSPNYKSGWTYMVLWKAALSKVLPNVDKVLCLDSDAIVVDDISEIFDTDVEDYYFAAVPEPKSSLNRAGEPYYNFGVSYQNLKKLREDRIDDKIIARLNTIYMPFKEQDTFPMLCKGHILNIGSEYNSCLYTEPTEHPKIIHFAARNNWRGLPVVTKFAAMTWSEVLHENPGSNPDI